MEGLEPRKKQPPPGSGPLTVQGFYSDLLYQPWFCATTPIRQEWLQRDTLERRSGLSVEDFREQFEIPNRPVVLSDAVRPPPDATAAVANVSGSRHAFATAHLQYLLDKENVCRASRCLLSVAAPS